MKKLCVMVVLGLLILGASCDTKNIGVDPNPNRLTVSVAALTGMNGGVDATWTAVIAGVFPPYAVAWNFGGGANPNTVADNTAGNSIVTVNNNDQNAERDVIKLNTETLLTQRLLGRINIHGSDRKQPDTLYGV